MLRDQIGIGSKGWRGYVLAMGGDQGSEIHQRKCQVSVAL